MKIVRRTPTGRSPDATVVIPVFKGAPLTAIWREFPELEYLPQEKNQGRERRNAGLPFPAAAAPVPAGRRRTAGPPGRRPHTGLPDHAPAAGKTRRPGAALFQRRSCRFTRGFLLNLVDYLHLNNYRFDRYRKKKQARPAHRSALQKTRACSGRGMAGARDRAIATWLSPRPGQRDPGQDHPRYHGPGLRRLAADHHG